MTVVCMCVYKCVCVAITTSVLLGYTFGRLCVFLFFLIIGLKS